MAIIWSIETTYLQKNKKSINISTTRENENASSPKELTKTSYKDSGADQSSQVINGTREDTERWERYDNGSAHNDES